MIGVFLLKIYKVSGGCTYISIIVLCNLSQDFDHKVCLLLNLEFSLTGAGLLPPASSSQPSLPILCYMKNLVQPQVLHWKHRTFPNKVLSKLQKALENHRYLFFLLRKQSASLTRCLMNITFCHSSLWETALKGVIMSCQKLKIINTESW